MELTTAYETGDYFNNPVEYFIEDTTGTPEGVCMGIIEFEIPVAFIQF